MAVEDVDIHDVSALKEELTLIDYLMTPVPKLVKHPNFSRHAARVADELLKLTTKQLEEIDVRELTT